MTFGRRLANMGAPVVRGLHCPSSQNLILGVVRWSDPQRSGRGRKNLDPDKMKLCPGYHNPFTSTVTTLADIYSGFGG